MRLSYQQQMNCNRKDQFISLSHILMKSEGNLYDDGVQKKTIYFWQKKDLNLR